MNGTFGTLIQELPGTERPRERLLSNGPDALTEAELLAILLRTGTHGRSALDLAQEVLAEVGGLAGLATADPQRLRRPGLGDAKVAGVRAACELARRLARSRLPDRISLGRPEQVAGYLSLKYGNGTQEIMGAVYLDVRNRLLSDRVHFRGTLSRAAVEPRALFKDALSVGAAGLILFHTHPSGDPSPSPEDLAVTRRMADAGEVLGVALLDHLILGGVGRWISLRQRGGW